MGLKILYIAEIVGKAGIWSVKTGLASLKKREKPDVVIANADGATGCAGLGRQHAGYLKKMGIDVITGGDSILFKKDLVESLDSVPYVLRPANYPPECPGRGWKMVQAGPHRVAVVSLLGRVGFSRVHGDNPFTLLPLLAERLRRETPYIVVDFHSGASAEKLAFFHHAAPQVSAVIGSHSRVQTADETVLLGKCAVITDAGRTGSIDSVGGCEIRSKIREYMSCVPDWSRDAWSRCELQGVCIELGDDGRAAAITRFRHDCGDPPESVRT